MNSEFPTHRFSWDGFSFDTPEDWDLSQYFFGKHTSSVQMEDECAVRLELEWTRPSRKVSASTLQARFAKSSGELGKVALTTDAVDSLPPGWSAVLYTMPEKRIFIIAFWLSPDGGFFGFFKLHFEKSGRTKPLRILHAIAETFVLHDTPHVPWDLYDISLTLSRDFRLVRTSLQAGRKLLVFQWRLRKLFIWQFSLADLLLKDKTMAEWAAEFLNSFKELPGPVFEAGENDIIIGRKRRYPFGHYEDIGRLCLKYKVGCVRLPEKNAILLAVFNYRRQADLNKIKESTRLPILSFGANA